MMNRQLCNFGEHFQSNIFLQMRIYVFADAIGAYGCQASAMRGRIRWEWQGCGHAAPRPWGKQGFRRKTKATHPTSWGSDQGIPGIISSCPKQTSRHILHPLAAKERGIVRENRRQGQPPVQHFVIESEDPPSDLVRAQNSLIMVHREQNRYITTPAGSGGNVPCMPKIPAEYALLDSAGGYLGCSHGQREGLLGGLRIHR